MKRFEAAKGKNLLIAHLVCDWLASLSCCCCCCCSSGVAARLSARFVVASDACFHVATQA